MNRRSTREILKQEINTVALKKNARFKAALIYPNRYYLGMSNLGIHVVYGLLNKRDDTVCERFFYEGQKQFLSIENASPLNSFDILAFSISYELDYFNAIAFLRDAGISFPAREQRVMPFIIVGGMVNGFNFLPLSGISDALFLGEAEQSLTAFMDSLSVFPHVDTIAKKKLFLSGVSLHKGIFVPGISKADEVKPCFIEDLDEYPTSTKIITAATEFSNTFLVEISRGCSRGCRFCVTGAVCAKFRSRTTDILFEEIERGLQYTSKIGLVGAAVSDYPWMEPLLRFLNKKKAMISVSSLRMETVSADLLGALARSGQRTVTFAPETGSDELRYAINKRISNIEIMKKIKLAKECGIKKLKLYFMIGLPGEQEKDINAIVDLAKAARDILSLRVNVGIFVPKPKTHFAKEPFADRRVLNSRLKFLKQKLIAEKNITLNTASIPEASKEAKLAFSDASFLDKYLSACLPARQGNRAPTIFDRFS